MKGSPARKMRRMAMKVNGMTFTQRLKDAVRTGTVVRGVNFTAKKDSIEGVKYPQS